jgi:tetratricopeptide (TPR) repeat protein
MKRRAFVLLALIASGCAGLFGARREDEGRLPALPGETQKAWAALVDGRVVEAQGRFEARAVNAPGDLVARFGRATVAYEHGDGPRALEDYTTVVTGARDAGAWGRLLAPVAAARALALLDDVGRDARARAEAALLAPARGLGLPWEARLELARLAERSARRSGDAAALEAGTRGRGCARAIFDAGSLGGLPHLDLDRVAAPPPPAEWTSVVASGCRLTLSSRDGRPTAERLRGAFEVPAGDYDLVLDYDGEARVALDGSAPLRHGSALRAGPRTSAFAVRLGAGRHELELRVATEGGRAELALLLLPRAAAGEGARFVDPRAAGGAKATPVQFLHEVPPADDPFAAPEVAALVDLARASAADRAGELDEALARAARLDARPRFAAGRALSATIARNDPTRPGGFARDAARARLRAAVGVDPLAARTWQTLAALDLEDEHAREAIDDAREATKAAPRWWAPELVLAHALRARGLERDADRALDRAVEKAGALATQPCLLVEAQLRRTEERRDLAAQARLEDTLAACDATSEVRIDRLRARGDLAGAAKALRAALRLAPDREDLTGDLAQVLWAGGHRAEALSELAGLVAREPRDPFLRVRLADAQAAAGQGATARQTVRNALTMRPDAAEVRRAARVLGVPLPLDAHRLDGRAVIRAFEDSGRKYAAPAVVVLDRSVTRVFPDGAQMTLTHEIVRVQSKDAIDRWAEVEVPPGAEVLALRTHKPDGTTREPEEIAGKETVSAANVAIGDYIEWETLETRGPSGAFAPGFLSERFYFQSFDAPLDRSELVLVTPRAVTPELDARAGAPAPRETFDPDGARVTTFVAANVPQLFAERAAVPAIEFVPSVRAGGGVTFSAWARYVEEQLYGTLRTSPALRERARTLAKAAGTQSAERLAAAVVAWVAENVEAVDDLRDAASTTLVRGRGNRLALMLALLREVGVPARAVLARSRVVAETDAPTPPLELDDFSEAILEIELPPAEKGGAARRVWADPRLRHAPFGYLPPSLDGARTLALADGRFGVARSTGTPDHRQVDVTIRLDEQGGGIAVATEELTGWPALEWAELVDRFGADRARLRQDFEQRWLGVQFPGARLRDLDVTLAKDVPAARVRVRYSFVSPQLAVRNDHEMRLLPTFFRSQPGRRFATEPQRSTTLVLGFDVPVHLTATVELPRSARVIDPPGEDVGARRAVERKGVYRFVEERHLRGGPTGGGDVLVLTRESALPLTRVAPSEYAGVAADLRRVDGIEQQEIRIRLRGARGGK